MRRVLMAGATAVVCALTPGVAATAGQDAYATFVTKFDRTGQQKFAGKVDSTKRRCEERRQVALYRKHDGAKRRMGSDRTSRRARFVVKLGHRPRDGRYFAKVEESKFRTNSGKLRTCRPARSTRIEID